MISSPSLVSMSLSTPLPSSLSYNWNFGSLLGLSLGVQLVSGLFLSFYYNSSIDVAFDSVEKICEEVKSGWLVRSIHANGASFFFIFLYLHVARGLMFKSFKSLKLVWVSGMVILTLSMGTAFLGYVLPWGQMSLWGATVITNLISALPAGSAMVQWIWGGFSVAEPTLIRFFSLHFILPFGVFLVVAAHIMILHSSGSSNPLGLDFNSDKLFFHPFFTIKDVMGVVFICSIFVTVFMLAGDIWMDPDNFTPANPLNTPPHIQPEWYFLFAYSILRSVPNKLGGVVALIMSILIMFILPVISQGRGIFPLPLYKMTCSLFFVCFILLTWIGSMPVEEPLVTIGQFLTFFYFMLVIFISRA